MPYTHATWLVLLYNFILAQHVGTCLVNMIYGPQLGSYIMLMVIYVIQIYKIYFRLYDEPLKLMVIYVNGEFYQTHGIMDEMCLYKDGKF